MIYILLFNAVFWILCLWEMNRLNKVIISQRVIIDTLLTKVVQQKCVIMDLYQSDARFTAQFKPMTLSITVEKKLRKKGKDK